jgi:hypothetical protein
VTAEAACEPPLTHQRARERFGLPDAREGSVNDPRTREEHGIRWNEKWIYFLAGGARRLVYWHRYDCRGVRIEAPDGGVGEEPG